MGSVRYVEAPNEWTREPYDELHYEFRYKVFLAGGITGCPDWQARARRLFEEEAASRDMNVALLNPRRANFDVGDPTAAETQIRWEHKWLRRVHIVMFWFPGSDPPQPQPIALYELGGFVHGYIKPYVVGVEPNYCRRFDIVTQLGLSQPDIAIHNSLVETVRAVFDEFDRFNDEVF